MTKRSQYSTVDKQLLQYFRRSASGIIFPRSTRNATIAFSFSALLSLVVNTTPLLFADKMCRKCCASPGGHGHDEELVEDCHRHRIRCLCIAVFASNILLMVTAACLTAVLNVIYLYLAAAVVFLVVAPYACHIETSTRNTVTWGIVQYEEFQDDIRYFFDLSSEATQAAFLGLPATLFSQLRRTECRRSVGVRAPEVLTMYTVLFIMLVCSVPLAADFKETREKFVRVFIRYSTYALLALLSVVAFLAAIEVLQAYIVLAFVLVFGAFLGGLFWHVNRAPRSPGRGAGEGDTAGVVARRRRSLIWFGFCPAMFGALMASYSRSVSGDGPGFSKLYRACVFFIFVSLIGSSPTSRGCYSFMRSRMRTARRRYCSSPDW